MELWIVKNLSKELILYKEQPFYNNKLDIWVGGGLPIGKLKGYPFPEVTFENSPQKIELKLIKK